jgi:hypothetical protein
LDIGCLCSVWRAGEYYLNQSFTTKQDVVRAGDEQFVYLKYCVLTIVRTMGTEKHAFDAFMITDRTYDAARRTCHAQNSACVRTMGIEKHAFHVLMITDLRTEFQRTRCRKTCMCTSYKTQRVWRTQAQTTRPCLFCFG